MMRENFKFCPPIETSEPWCVARMVSDRPRGLPISTLIQPPQPAGVLCAEKTISKTTAEDMGRIRVIAASVLEALRWLRAQTMNHRDLQVRVLEYACFIYDWDCC